MKINICHLQIIHIVGLFRTCRKTSNQDVQEFIVTNLKEIKACFNDCHSKVFDISNQRMPSKTL